MSCKVTVTDRFWSDAKALNKRYPSFKSDLGRLVESPSQNPTQGDLLKPNCFKFRMSIASKGRGKSGGARVITYVVKDAEIFLISVYDKSDRSSIKDSDLESLLQEFEENQNDQSATTGNTETEP